MLRTPQSTAYHEAAHAVMYLHMGMEFATVSIIENDDTLGRVVDVYTHVNPYQKWDQETRSDASRYVLIFLAGAAAEEKAFGECDQAGCSDDFDDAYGLSTRLCTRSGDPFAYRDRKFREARTILNRPYVWMQVRTLANALLEQNTLTYEEVLKLLGVSRNFVT